MADLWFLPARAPGAPRLLRSAHSFSAPERAALLVAAMSARAILDPGGEADGWAVVDGASVEYVLPVPSRCRDWRPPRGGRHAS